MKRVHIIHLVLWALVPTAGIMAQPVIGLSNMPQVGDSVIIALSNQPVAPGTAGADQTWDMTWISAAEEQYFVYEDPAVTPWADLFDDATICGRSWEDYYSYYHIDATGVAAVGYAGVIGLSDTFTMDYSDSELFIPLDYSFGDSHADDFAGTSTAAGFSLPFTGDVDFEADGYGTLILPTGTYENVVRYHFPEHRRSPSALPPPQQRNNGPGYLLTIVSGCCLWKRTLTASAPPLLSGMIRHPCLPYRWQLDQLKIILSDCFLTLFQHNSHCLLNGMNKAMRSLHLQISMAAKSGREIWN